MTAPPTDPYTILGVGTGASDDDLDRAFRGLVRQLHPDTRVTSAGHDADVRLQELLDAYATLRDPIRRAAYDRARTIAAKVKPTAPGPLRGRPQIRVGPVYWEPL
ncbi:J domain-containing protein [Kribbella sp. NPDC056345]|uniref:J domain-containing protein n=1 Tax=Kribbella sp. NPDC056345 TaxID=3345789 RepID=UPI0035D95485